MNDIDFEGCCMAVDFGTGNALPLRVGELTEEILEYRQQAGQAVLEIGKRLMEAKELLSHGEWLPWLTEQVEFSERSAQNFMALARGFSNPQTLADLGASKALALLALTPLEREEFLAESHTVSGAEKTVEEMSVRELERVMKERDEALAARETAERETASAEESRAKMAADMGLLKERLAGVDGEVEHREAEAVRLRAELEELRTRPVEVAVQDAAPEELERVRAEGVQEAQSKVAAQLAEKESAVQAAQEQLIAVQREKEDARAQLAELEERLVQAEQEAGRVKRELETVGQRELATFGVLYGQVQETIGKMAELLEKLEPETQEKMRRALVALGEAVREVAKQDIA